MKFLRFSLFALPLLFAPFALSQERNELSNPNYLVQPNEEDKIQMQQEEEEYDAFGENEYNENVDPDVYEIDKEINSESETRVNKN